VGKHYEESDWIDYLKGLAPYPRADMARHVEECETCRERIAFCRELSEFIEQKTSGDPPEEWIREALAGFDSSGASEHPEIFAGLTYDTFIQTPLGLRSGNINERQLRFETERFRIDMTADVAGRKLKSVVGHLGCKGDPPPYQDVPVELSIGKVNLSTRMNELGEFHFSVGSELTGDPLELRFKFGGGPCLCRPGIRYSATFCRSGRCV